MTRCKPFPTQQLTFSSLIRHNILHSPIRTCLRHPSPPSSIRHNSTTVPLKFLPPRDLLIQVSIGTPPKPFTLLLDTGSTDLWIRHTSLLPYSRGTTYTHSASSSFLQTRSHWGVKYLDNTIAEGFEGVEKVRLGETEVDCRVGVAKKIWTDDGSGPKGQIVGVRAGRKGVQGIDGILGMGLEGSFVDGLQNAGIKAVRLKFKRIKDGKQEGEDTLELLKEVPQEEVGIVWYDVIKGSGESGWEIGLRKVFYQGFSYPVPRNQKISVDTGATHVYFPRSLSDSLLRLSPLSKHYTQVRFVPSHTQAHEKAESGWHLHTPPSSPFSSLELQFTGNTLKLPLSLDPPLEDEYASIRTARDGGRIMLGMAFLAKQRGVVFDLTRGKERVGIMPWEKVEGGSGYRENRRDHVLQFAVGALLALGIVSGWRWYSSNESNKE